MKRSTKIKNKAEIVLHSYLSKKVGYVENTHKDNYFDCIINAKKASSNISTYTTIVDLSMMPDWKEYFKTPYIIRLNF